MDAEKRHRYIDSSWFLAQCTAGRGDHPFKCLDEEEAFHDMVDEISDYVVAWRG